MSVVYVTLDTAGPILTIEVPHLVETNSAVFVRISSDEPMDNSQSILYTDRYTTIPLELNRVSDTLLEGWLHTTKESIASLTVTVRDELMNTTTVTRQFHVVRNISNTDTKLKIYHRYQIPPIHIRTKPLQHGLREKPFQHDTREY